MGSNIAVDEPALYLSTDMFAVLLVGRSWKIKYSLYLEGSEWRWVIGR